MARIQSAPAFRPIARHGSPWLASSATSGSLALPGRRSRRSTSRCRSRHSTSQARCWCAPPAIPQASETLRERFMPSIRISRSKMCRTLDDLRAEALAAPRLTATLLAIFAALALLMTLAGIGGVIATSVTAAHQGVRRAHGPWCRTRQPCLRWSCGRADAGGDRSCDRTRRRLVLSRVLSAYLYQTTPHDPLVLMTRCGGIPHGRRDRLPRPGTAGDNG